MKRNHFKTRPIKDNSVIYNSVLVAHSIDNEKNDLFTVKYCLAIVVMYVHRSH